MNDTNYSYRCARIACVALLLAFTAVTGIFAESEIIKLEAVASYYGEEFQGRPTSSGEIFDMNALTAAHKTLPFGTMLEVTNLENGRKSVVRVNDRGPFVAGRELDVSKAAAFELGMVTTGTARVSIRRIGRAVDNATASNGSAVAENGGKLTVTVTQTVSKTTMDAPASSEGTAVATITPAAITPDTLRRIQLGSFSKEENATRFAVQLRKDGFNPSFERSGSMIRVVLSGIGQEEIAGMKGKLAGAGYRDYLIREE